MVTGAVMVVALGGVELDPSTDSGACSGGVNIASVLSSEPPGRSHLRSLILNRATS